jgi:amino acid transporter
MATPDMESGSPPVKDEKNLTPSDNSPGYLDDDDVGEFEEVHTVKQGLHQRHIQMIALAGTIGTGLFLGSGKAIARSGPLGAFLGYSFVGLAVSSVVCAVGEMGALVPLNGGVVRYAEYFFDPALSFANGWNQVYSYTVSIPAESK